MSDDQMLALLGMLTDTVTAQRAQIDALSAYVQALTENVDRPAREEAQGQ